MFAVTVLFRIRADHFEDFRTAVMRHAKNSLSEPGCRQFDVCFSDDYPHDVFLYEAYEDEAAFQTHRGMPYFAQFGATVADWVESKELRTWSVSRPAESK